MRIWFCLIILWSVANLVQAKTIRIATFNASMDGSNYVARGERPKGNELATRLVSGKEPQIQNIAEIIQIVRPDILLINEFDYIPDETKGVQAFLKHYLSVSQQGKAPINYPYYFTAPVNTGVGTGLDLDKDGTASDVGADAFGFGFYPGQYGMVVLSQFPINKEMVRTFQHFLWKDMPGSLLTDIKDDEGKEWYNKEAQAILRLSSKSHWDIPISVDGNELHVLVSHPTPPVFDGKENRNGKRNHDEVRFWNDYLGDKEQGGYLYDDQGGKGGFTGGRFVLLGDLNSNPDEGDSYGHAIADLLNHKKVNASLKPESQGGAKHQPNNPFAKHHTAGWGMRADYVLPSQEGIEVISGGVFWPTPEEPLYRLVVDRNASSDHRLVWLDVTLQTQK
ncbi:endonuclease/exonuclease/phosphatase family protein [Paraneptunicella aestuarii]|uniref:endonuclease/exonuclease/phosphatase family protein n=1 Tax=Paraneptunicella aestuarii TaxID=2831148 RepID=UPI001E3B4F26|nr:endonuclease/exonuclease/phosphatase family protein [Paraneptunicella aestuarii]UAA39400.1 endonuclease/exonuclease/phosphatase family protein [Paraneptunicella aestuarii]